MTTQKQNDFNNALIAILIITLVVIICAIALRHVFGDHVAGIVPEPEPQRQYVSHILIEPGPKTSTETAYAVPEFLHQEIAEINKEDSVYSE